MKLVTILKGSDTSGNFSHVGRPGKVGGSAKRTTTVTLSTSEKIEQEITKFCETYGSLNTIYHVEYASTIGGNGELMMSIGGDATQCTILPTSQDKDGVLIHNHPPHVFDANGNHTNGTRWDTSQPLSPSDLLVAAKRNFAKVIAIGYYNGGRIRFVFERPSKGWPDPKKVHDLFTENIEFAQAANSLHHVKTVDDPAKYSYTILNGALRGLADDIGGKYTYELYN